jgi:hypothetical protein
MRTIAESDWRVAPVAIRLRYAEEARRMIAVPADDPAARFIIDQMFYGPSGLERAVNAICLAVAPRTEGRVQHRVALMLPDTLPAVVNGLWGMIAVLSAELFWVATAWSGGQAIVTFSALWSPCSRRMATTLPQPDRLLGWHDRRLHARRVLQLRRDVDCKRLCRTFACTCLCPRTD